MVDNNPNIEDNKNSNPNIEDSNSRNSLYNVIYVYVRNSTFESPDWGVISKVQKSYPSCLR